MLAKLALLAAAAQAAVPGDLVTSLPGFGAPPTPWYSGYLSFIGINGAPLHMHYIFITAPGTNSIAAWFNGGRSWRGKRRLFFLSFFFFPGLVSHALFFPFPTAAGCSSLEGLFQEMGQLWVDETDPTKLVVNPNAWTNVSSMLFLEAPACVGYSYTDAIIGCSHNDTSQAIDNYAAVKTFFTSFPEYASNDFFITGESVRRAGARSPRAHPSRAAPHPSPSSPSL